MTKSDFINYIDTMVSGTTTGSFTVDTEVKMVKNNPFGSVRCEQTLNGVIGFDYSNSVNNLAEKENKVERDAKNRAWGQLSDNRIWVKHTPKGSTEERTYLQMKVERRLDNATTSPKYYDANGNVLSYDDIKDFKVSKGKSSTQADLSGEVVVRDINVENIKVAKVFGQTITLEDK